GPLALPEIDVAERAELVDEKVAHVALENGAGAMSGVADGLDLERGGWRGVPPDVRLARGAGPLVGPQTSQGRPGRAPDRRLRITERAHQRLARQDRPDLAQGVGGGGA